MRQIFVCGRCGSSLFSAEGARLWNSLCVITAKSPEARVLSPPNVGVEPVPPAGGSGCGIGYWFMFFEVPIAGI